MRHLALLLVALLAFAALAPQVGAQPAAAPVTFYLSSTPGSVGGIGSVETLSVAPPTKTDDSLRNLTGPASWYNAGGTGLPGAVNFTSSVEGTLHLLVTPISGLPLGFTVQNTVTVELRKVGLDGAEVVLGNTSVAIQTAFAPPLAANSSAVAFSIAQPNQSLLAGEVLALNVSASSQGLGALAVQYDSVAHPSNFTVSLQRRATGSLQLSATTTSRDAAPGSSPTYVVTVRNLADTADTVSLSVAGVPAEWATRVTPSSLPLAAGSAGSVLVTVTVPAGTAEGARHTAALTATSINGATPPPLNLTTTVRAASGTPGDRDGDGSSDAEETRYSSNPNDRSSTPDNTDSDNDGVSNRAEVDAGTDPFDPDDFPGAPNGGSQGGTNPGGASALGFLSGPIAQATGVDAATADLLAILLLLLFLIILALLIWFLFFGYPVTVALIEARAVTEPGRGADYAVEVRSKLGRSQQVDLEAAGLPSDWDVRFNKTHLTLEAKQVETVGMLVRPPAAWPAPSKREFQVRARSRVKPEKFAQAIARMLIQPRPVGLVDPPQEDAFPEAPAEAYAPPSDREPVPVPYVVPVPAGGDVQPFRVTIRDVRHNPTVPERGAEVTTTSRVDNNGTRPETLRVVLVVNGKVRDEVRVDLGPGEGAEAEFRWVAYLARNEVKVVAERA